jgi:hypothetical protein
MFTYLLMTGAKEFSKCKLDFVGVQEVRWDRDDTEAAANIHFSMEIGMRITNEVQIFLYIRESYQQLRG